MWMSKTKSKQILPPRSKKSLDKIWLRSCINNNKSWYTSSSSSEWTFFFAKKHQWKKKLFLIETISIPKQLNLKKVYYKITLLDSAIPNQVFNNIILRIKIWSLISLEAQ